MIFFAKWNIADALNNINFNSNDISMIPARGPQTTVYTEIKNPSNVSVVWVII